MPLSSFHPVVRTWFTQTLGDPTPAQARGWASIRDGRHTLIAAPTGSGKTLAAFLTALDELLDGADEIVVGTVARLFRRKGYEQLIPIMAAAAAREPAAERPLLTAITGLRARRIARIAGL